MMKSSATLRLEPQSQLRAVALAGTDASRRLGMVAVWARHADMVAPVWSKRISLRRRYVSFASCICFELK